MFLNDDFILESEWAKKLYHNYAKKMPIIDYHCHLSAKEIYENKNYSDFTQMSLADNKQGDHYKWRLIRSNGYNEDYITGNKDNYDKYLAFVKTLEQAIGNPIYEWTYLELKRYFNINEIINQDNAKEIWDKINKMLVLDEYRPINLIKKMNVEVIGTTDDPLDDLKYHSLLNDAKDINGFKLIASFRPDTLLNIDDENYKDYLIRMEKVVNHKINDIYSLEKAIINRLEYFNDNGCCLSDHGLNNFVFEKTSQKEANIIILKMLDNSVLNKEDIIKYQSYMQIFLMKEYVRLNWTMQLHLNVLRNNSSIDKVNIGINSGFDSVGVQYSIVEEIIKCFDYAKENNALSRIILYTLNQSDYLPLLSAMQCFQGDLKQRIQLGSAWWFNDNLDGIAYQLRMLAQQSLLGNFIGMLTDSRSILSYSRHEYFRRILCNVIAKWVEQGLVYDDEKFLGKIVENICYFNAKEQLNIL